VSSQFGTVCDQTDYSTDVHTLSVNADYTATEKLNLYASAMYSDAKADWSNLNISAPAYVTDAVVNELYSFDAINVITTYSDLHYQQTDLSLGGTYQFSPTFYLTARADYQIFTDLDPYVYGDQDGTAYRGSLGVGYKF